jgi:phage FluMu protein Com
MSKYITTDTFPQSYTVRGVTYRWVKCWRCKEIVFMIGDKLKPHQTCEGGNRFYYHMFGTRMESENGKVNVCSLDR